MLPGFHLRTLRRKPRSAQQKLAEKIALLKQKSFKQIGELFEKFIPRPLLKQEQNGGHQLPEAFFSQVLDTDGGCKEVIRKLQSYASIKGVKIPSSSTASQPGDRRETSVFPLTLLIMDVPGIRQEFVYVNFNFNLRFT